MPSRQPRMPSIGLNSCSSLTRRAIASAVTPILLGQLRLALGRRAAGTRAAADRAVRIVTGWPFIARNRPSKSSRWNGSSLASAFSRSSGVVGQDHLAQSSMWSKNMCSVRHRPMPSAPKAIASSGLVGLVGVGADLAACGARRPSSISCCEAAGRSPTSSGFSVLSISTCTTSLGLVATWPVDHLAGEAVDARCSRRP